MQTGGGGEELGGFRITLTRRGGEISGLRRTKKKKKKGRNRARVQRKDGRKGQTERTRKDSRRKKATEGGMA